jgi:hypothetical protein
MSPSPPTTNTQRRKGRGMKEHPILFSGPMVQAILANRKTQTRRKVKLLPWMYRAKMTLAEAWADMGFGDGWYLKVKHEPSDALQRVYCPCGKVGDRLWVRETWAQYNGSDSPHAFYKADWHSDQPPIWKPSIHMPRWASRITLEITAVRVERLQDTSEADCLAEGIQRCTKDGELYKYGWDALPWVYWALNPRVAYRALWESINGPESWEANPWVWVIEFKRVEA